MTEMTPFFFYTLQDVLAVHDLVLGHGLPGIRDQKILHNCVSSCHAGFGGMDFYPGLLEKTAKIVSTLIQEHPFCDGNKRTGCAVLCGLLLANGLELQLDDNELYDLIIALATHRVSHSALVTLLQHKTYRIHKA